MTRRQEILGKFTLRPDEVKTYLVPWDWGSLPVDWGTTWPEYAILIDLIGVIYISHNFFRVVSYYYHSQALAKRQQSERHWIATTRTSGNNSGRSWFSKLSVFVPNYSWYEMQFLDTITVFSMATEDRYVIAKMLQKRCCPWQFVITTIEPRRTLVLLRLLEPWTTWTLFHQLEVSCA
jgi:hypothetical protein